MVKINKPSSETNLRINFWKEYYNYKKKELILVFADRHKCRPHWKYCRHDFFVSNKINLSTLTDEKWDSQWSVWVHSVFDHVVQRSHHIHVYSNCLCAKRKNGGCCKYDWKLECFPIPPWIEAQWARTDIACDAAIQNFMWILAARRNFQ